ncbi:hypothetical protein KY290_026907 [Solanum tuberosum]|uniref:Protein kinase domain-containing protein n=1 Tax=Solanum tuberosum TaxID=4113 RepID=A0ABQ7UZV4_SOLTU|nr:hypothetical protein KY290_026907 [Solanum tuberosum]
MPVGLHLMTMQTQVPRISLLHVVDPAEHSRVSGEPPCFPEDSVSAELRKPGQGFAWGQQWSPGAGPAQGVGSGRDSKGNFTDLTFPYSLPTQPDCGIMFLSGCDAKPFLRIQLVPGGEWYFALEMHNSSVWIADTKLQTTLRQHKCFSIYYKLSRDDDQYIGAGNLPTNCSLIKCQFTQGKGQSHVGAKVWLGAEPYVIKSIGVANVSTLPVGTSKRGYLRIIWFMVATGASLLTIGLLVLLFCFKKMILWYKYIRYNYTYIKRITGRFRSKLGQGGFGNVYRGSLSNGSEVAVNVLNELKGTGEDFINEVASISRTSHVNIVSLVGFCFEGHKRALVYEFMPNGSLEKFIYEERSDSVCQLGWPILYKIALGIARGLEYLHRGCNTWILHFDIKPHNILLDEDFCPKISDFGFAKLCIKKESIVSMLGARGTIGYIAPEVVGKNLGGVSHKSDVYSYGMMVLEMVGGRKYVDIGVDRTSEIYFPHWLYRRIELDEELQLIGKMNEEENECARKMVIASLWCIQTDPANRPSMSKVVEMLEGKLDSLQMPPKPYLFFPSRSEVDSSIIELTTTT